MGSSLHDRNQQIKQESAFIEDIRTETRRIVVGQQQMIDRMLICMLSNGHMLIEGLPGLAKSLTVNTLAATVNMQFQRIQFTPDLLPADLIGTEIYNPATGEFTPKFGPIFSNIVLADEINRAPSKVQSALLEAMGERQVTIGEKTYKLAEPYLVLATQNPIEQEGTYPLPEAQLDRFMLKVIITYPSRDEEREILTRMGGARPNPPRAVIEPQKILNARDIVNEIYIDNRLKDYILDIIFATRFPTDHGFKGLADLIAVGASPRATLFLTKAARASAFLNGRGFVIPDDIKLVALDVLRHRIQTTFEAEADGIKTEEIIEKIIRQVKVP